MQSKGPCRFKGDCKNYKAGLNCPFSHDKCKFGSNCNNKQKCKFFHDEGTSSSIPTSKFDKPMNETQCKFGASCKRLAEGKCYFKHSPNNNSIQAQRPGRVDNRSQMPCKFGDQCKFYKQGKCPYKHQSSQKGTQSNPGSFSVCQPGIQPQFTPSIAQVYSSPQTSVLDQFCPNFLSNSYCPESCPKSHSLSISNTINRIFSMEQAFQIKKLLVMEPYQPEEQPLYVILSQNRVMFGQLTNLAKQSGNQHIRTTQLVMKRCFNCDIELPGETIRDIWLIKAENKTQRDDFLVIQSNKAMSIIIINKSRLNRQEMNQPIKDIVYINNTIVVLTQTRKVLGFKYDQEGCDFRPIGQVLTQPLQFVKKYNKCVQGEQFAAGLVNKTYICFINKQFKTYCMDLKQNIKDVCFTQYGGQPTALVLTENGVIIAINLVTFATLNILKTNLPDTFKCVSITITLQHLILAVDGLGVLSYNCENLNQINGILLIAPYKWHVECNQNGIVTILSQDHTSNKALNIYKISKF